MPLVLGGRLTTPAFASAINDISHILHVIMILIWYAACLQAELDPQALLAVTQQGLFFGGCPRCWRTPLLLYATQGLAHRHVMCVA